MPEARRPSFLVVITVCCVATALFTGVRLFGSQRSGSAQSDRDRFVGAWRLVSLEEQDADGKVHRTDCTGLFVFSRDGHASVQVMYRSAAAGNAGSVQYAQGGYEASYGRFEVDEGTHRWTFHIEGALVRDLVGKDLARTYDLSGNQLIVKP